MKQLPKYRCHKEVHAVKIKRIRVGSPLYGDPLADVVIIPEQEDIGEIRIDSKYINKHKPKKGGYYVVYEDGYKSYSPPKAFEDGYTLIEDTEPKGKDV